MILFSSLFRTVLILLGLIEYSLVRYCTTSSPTDADRSTKQYILRIFVMCMAIADAVHVCSFLNYQLAYGSLLDLSAIGNVHTCTVLIVARIIYLWLNYQNEKKKQNKKQ
jgi:preprotein translocase subunit SecY